MVLNKSGQFNKRILIFKFSKFKGSINKKEKGWVSNSKWNQSDQSVITISLKNKFSLECTPNYSSFFATTISDVNNSKVDEKNIISP